MSLYERLLGLPDPDRPNEPLKRISAHVFMGMMQEYMLGTNSITAAQVQTALDLNAQELTDAGAIRTRILAETNANTTTQGILRRLKAQEIEQTILLAQLTVPNGLAPISTIAALKSRIGV